MAIGLQKEQTGLTDMTMIPQTYPYKYLHEYATAVLLKFGFSDEHAKLCATVFMAAELRGIPSHGIMRLNDFYPLLASGRMNVNPEFRIEHKTPSTALLDGDNTIGILPAHRGMQIAIEKAEHAGTGWVAVSNSSNFGITGYFAMMALEHDMIGFACTNTTPLVTPTFGVASMLGTNPIAVAVPTGKQPPFVADFATTPVTRGKVSIYEKEGEKMGFGFVEDAEGNPSDDPTVLNRGGHMLPLGGDREHGGHKGYCLGAIVDILSGVLSGANFGQFVPPMLAPPLYDEQQGKGCGHFFGAMRIDAFSDSETFKGRMDKWIETMRNTKPAKGHESVLIPGDPERECEERIAREGIRLLPQVMEESCAIAEKLGINFKKI
ncbi:Ureidoglycolate dehydrogenase [Bacteroidales bacterium Barb7]|nr:Ureidoglycolate dehydrogenase [Bacteroidales bacterium Barb7]